MKKDEVIEVSPAVEQKIRHSLDTSIVEGSFAAAMNGFGVSYFSPFAIALNATSSQVGLMSALISLLPSVVQLKGARLIEKFSRKKVVVTGVLLQALMFVPLILLGLFFSGTSWVVWAVISFVCLIYGFGSVAYPAWFSWMGSLVPEDHRGRYFARRNRITGFFGLVSMIAGAFILEQFKILGWVMIGFGILFALAGICRFIAMLLFKKHYEPKLVIHKKDYFSFWSFLKHLDTPFGRFAVYTTLFKIALGIATPFFAVYILRDLNLGYLWFMVISVAGTLFHLLFLPVLGKFGDKYGNIKLLKLASFCFMISPFLWMVSKNPYYLMSVPKLFGGIAWAGLGLASGNYIYDAVRQEKRSFGLAYFNLLNGVGMFVGAGIGSLIALANIAFMNKILFIFLISGILRILLFAFDSGLLREVRHVDKFKYQFLVKEFNPVQGFVREIHGLEKFGHKIGDRFLNGVSNKR